MSKLSEEDVDRIARAVVELLKDRQPITITLPSPPPMPHYAPFNPYWPPAVYC